MTRQMRQPSPAQAMVEFALVAPLVLLLIFGIIDFARLIQANVTVRHAAREAARFTVTGQRLPDGGGGLLSRAGSGRETARQALAGLYLDSSTHDPQRPGYYDIRVNPPDAGDPLGLVEVTVEYNFLFITPVLSSVFPPFHVSAMERMVNEAYGNIPLLDRANIPNTPVPLPTYTPYPTYTPVPTYTPTPTATPTTVPTPTSTPTP